MPERNEYQAALFRTILLLLLVKYSLPSLVTHACLFSAELYVHDILGLGFFTGRCMLFSYWPWRSEGGHCMRFVYTDLEVRPLTLCATPVCWPCSRVVDVVCYFCTDLAVDAVYDSCIMTLAEVRPLTLYATSVYWPCSPAVDVVYESTPVYWHYRPVVNIVCDSCIPTLIVVRPLTLYATPLYWPYSPTVDVVCDSIILTLQSHRGRCMRLLYTDLEVQRLMVYATLL